MTENRQGPPETETPAAAPETPAAAPSATPASSPSPASTATAAAASATSAATSAASAATAQTAAGATQAAAGAAASAASAAAPASEAAATASRAASTAQAAASSAQGIASGVQQGGAAGALSSAGSAASLAGAAAPVAGASSAARETLSAVQQGVGAGQQVASLGQSVIPASSPTPGASSAGASSSSAAGGAGGSPASRAQSAVAAMLGTPGDGVTVAFTTDGSVGTVWTASQISISETMSAPYVAHLSLVTHDVHADAADLLGASCTISIERGSLERLVHGIVEEVTTGAESTREAHTSACTIRVVPALALLAHTRQSRIFQEMTVVDILEEVLTKPLQGFQRTVRIEVERELPTYEYRTQYDESDLSFVQRLLAEEGLFYFFDQSGSEEELVIVDEASKYPSLASTQADRLPFVNAGSPGNHEAITAFHRSDRIQPTVVSLRHYDWSKAATTEAKEAAASGDDPHAPGASRGAAREIYEHDSAPTTLSAYDVGTFKYTKEDSAAQVLLRRHRAIQEARTFDGDATSIGLAPGVAFRMTGHSRGELDGEYVVVRVSHSITIGDSSQSHGAAATLQATYSNHFVCVPADVPYRHIRGVDKPRVRGILTAKVVGHGEEEIHTDHYGRIRVQFHWDRIGVENEKSSCFLRVVQPWAGAGWGFVFTPRVGMEVVVTFIDGDPDRPVVTGALYNAENQPPYPLPDEHTKSGIKTNSTKGASAADATGYNELTFEDKAGAEQIIIHAQKDFNETVENAHSTTVKGGQTNSVGGDRSVSVSGNQTVSVKKDETYTVTQNRTTKVDGGNDHLTVATEWKLTVGASTITVTDGKIVMTTGGSTLTLDHAIVDLKSHDGGQVYLTADALMKSSSGAHVKFDANATMVSSGGSSVTLDSNAKMAASGGGGVTLDSNAAVNGAEVSLAGQSKVAAGAGPSSMTLEAAGASISGPKVTSSAMGIHEIAGAMIKIG